MLLVLLWAPPLLLMLGGFFWLQAAVHQIRHKPFGGKTSSRDWLMLTGAVALLVVGIAVAAWVGHGFFSDGSNYVEPPSPDDVCC